jgi:hypothetical protein
VTIPEAETATQGWNSIRAAERTENDAAIAQLRTSTTDICIAVARLASTPFTPSFGKSAIIAANNAETKAQPSQS